MSRPTQPARNAPDGAPDRAPLRTAATRLKRLATARYQTSVIRRTAVLSCLVLPAFGANFLVHYFAAALLSSENFGLFYVANTLSNVLFSGSVVLNTFFTKYLVSSLRQHGETGAFAATRGVERAVMLWGGACAGAVFLMLLGAGWRVGVESWAVVLLVVLDAYTAYVADVGRTLLQSLRRTVQLGLYTLIWMVLRLAFCLAGILAFGTVWGALLGIVLSAVVVLVGFRLWSAGRMETAIAAVPRLPSPLGLVPIVVGYGLLIALSNLDVLLSYFLLDGGELGEYSASSVFPKAILVATMPMVQMLFAMMAGDHETRRGARAVERKSGAAVLALTLAGAAAVWLLSDWLCGGRWGLRLCAPVILQTLLLSVIPLSLVRVFVLIQFARGHDWRVLWLAVPIPVYVYFAWFSPHTVGTMAQGFALFSLTTLVVFTALSAAIDWRRRPA